MHGFYCSHLIPCIFLKGLYFFTNFSFSVLVVAANKQQCQASYAIQVPAPEGFLSSVVTAETGCGTSYHPWVIEVDPTQRINITLFDFSAESGRFQRSPVGVCRDYAVIKEEGTRSINVSHLQEFLAFHFTMYVE